MKRLFSISILLFYMTGVMGIGYSVHYCCGRPGAVKIAYSNPGRDAQRNNSHSEKTCCREVCSFFKLHDPQVNTSIIQFVNLHASGTPFFIFSNSRRFSDSWMNPVYVNQWPPPAYRVPVYLLHSSIRI